MSSKDSAEISETDRKLLDELRKRITRELELVPAYDDDFSLMRWLIGWDRKIGECCEEPLQKMHFYFRCRGSQTQILSSRYPRTRSWFRRPVNTGKGHQEVRRLQCSTEISARFSDWIWQGKQCDFSTNDRTSWCSWTHASHPKLGSVSHEDCWKRGSHANYQVGCGETHVTLVWEEIVTVWVVTKTMCVVGNWRRSTENRSELLWSSTWTDYLWPKLIWPRWNV